MPGISEAVARRELWCAGQVSACGHLGNAQKNLPAVREALRLTTSTPERVSQRTSVLGSVQSKLLQLGMCVCVCYYKQKCEEYIGE